MKLVGANARAVATGLEKQPGIVSYFIGNDPRKWRTRVPTYARAKLAGVYPGIDLVYYGVGGERREAAIWSAGARSSFAQGSLLPPLSATTRREARAASRPDAVRRRAAPLQTSSALEYDFIVKPGADPRRISLAFEGAERVRVADGDLIISTPAGDVRMKRPYAYQTVRKKRVQVACDYRLHSPAAPRCSSGVGLSLARYNVSRPLVVDPLLEYSTYLGGSNGSWSQGIAVDRAGCAHVAGYTSCVDFPTTPGTLQTAFAGYDDGFVTKLNATGTALVFSTYVGGNDFDKIRDIAVDPSGRVYVVGETSSSTFPTTPGAFQTTKAGGYGDAFAASLSPSGASLEYSTYLGGSGNEQALGVACDAAGAAYVTGGTTSPNFPTTPGALQTAWAADYDAFATKLAPSGAALAYSTYLGGSGHDRGARVALDGSGCAYITGRTNSIDFPTTPSAFDVGHNGGTDVFVTKLDGPGATLVYSTFLGGTPDDLGMGIAVDTTGAAYVIGQTNSADYPVTAGAFDTTHEAHRPACFVTKLMPSGAALAYSTFLSGSYQDQGRAIAVDSEGSAYVTGFAASADFPVTSGALQTMHGGADDTFITRLNTTGSGLVYSTYLGGGADDSGDGIVVPQSGLAYVAGKTLSADLPTTPGAFSRTRTGYCDAYVAKVLAPPFGTTLYTLDRSGVITESVTLRGYLRRSSDNAWIAARTVGFSIEGTVVGSSVTDATGRADLPWTITAGPAMRTILAGFAGDTAYLPSSGTAMLTARTVSTKMIGYDRAGRITEYTTLRALLWRTDNTPVVAKTVAFLIDGTPVGSRATNANGRALIGYTIADGAGAGARTIVADWPGDEGYRASSASSALYVSKSVPYIWVLSKSVPVGGIANLYAYFRRLDDLQKQTGKDVVFSIEGTPVGAVTTDVSAVARYLYQTTEPVGVYTIRCEFAGDAWLDAGYGEANLTIY